MTVARVSQVATEVIRINTAVNVRLSQVAVEVIAANPGVICRLDQLSVEVIRPNVDVAVPSTARPQVFVCT